MVKNKRGFTLVEILAVIFVLGLVLIIAVPTVMEIIDDSKKRTFELTAKSVAKSAEEKYIENETLGIEEEITCENISDISNDDFSLCQIQFDEMGIASITLKGKGRYKGLSIYGGTKTNVQITSEKAELIKLTVNANGGNNYVNYKSKYESGSTVTLTPPTKEGYEFKGWIIVSGTDASVDGNTLTMGTTATEVKASWSLFVISGSSYITNLYKKESELNNGLVHLIEEYEDTTYDAGIRYVGENPNNYVYFNCKDKDSNNIDYGEEAYDYANSCEIWRIIGVFDTKKTDSETETPEKRIKIVRERFLKSDGSFLGMALDSSANGYGINQWGESTYKDGTIYHGADIMRLLNGYYLGKEGATCRYCNDSNQGTCTNGCSTSITPLSKTSLNMVEDALWHLGAVSYAESLLDTYNKERSNATGNSTEVNYTTKWIGKVGLIYPSDYGYASANEICVNRLYGSDCYTNNWLQDTKASYWTITPQLSTNSSLFYIGWSGGISINSATFAIGIRPTLYLSSNVKIIGGNGDDEPFKLAM